jgi:hypothetical protein
MVADPRAAAHRDDGRELTAAAGSQSWHDGDGFGATAIIALLAVAMLLGYWSHRLDPPGPGEIVQFVRTVVTPGPQSNR